MSYSNFEKAKAKISCPKAREIFVENIIENGWQNYRYSDDIIDAFSSNSEEARFRQTCWHITIPKGARL